MKKFLFAILLFVSGSTFAANNYLFDGENKGSTTREIEIRESKSSELADARQIVVPAVEALLNCDNGELTFTFNENIGEVTITVTDENGDVVATKVCYGNATTTLLVPTTLGTYTIVIAGEQYNGGGEYEL